MVPQSSRLSKKEDVQRVIKKGKFVRTSYLGAKYLETRLPGTRVGVVVGQKISKKAVERNRLKRRVREIIRGLLPALKEGYDVVLFPAQDAQYLTIQQLHDEIATLFRKVNIFK